MNDIPEGYFRDDNGILKQIALNGAKSMENATNPALSEGEWLEMQPRLATMSSEQLIATVRRFACQCGVVALMTKEETAQAMRDVLAETALRPIVPGINLKADIQARLAAIDKWLDRDEGKPMQRQAIMSQSKTTLDFTGDSGVIKIIHVKA